MISPQEFDEATLSALMQQDDLAFKKLVKRYHPMLLALANSIVGEAFGEEVVQDAWISIYQNLPGFQRKSSLKTWVYRITSNKAISRLRREKKHINFSSLQPESYDRETDCFDASGHWASSQAKWEMDQPDAQLFTQELQDCINHVLSQLPPLQQAIFMMNDVEGESSSDTCNNLEITASNMRVLLHRARFKLYSHINHFQETGEC
ncbi:MAG: RNA polymerase sigma factor [Pseudomonadales bacterium]|nr:RNA polymerase sigma factor [Pseudomonadales bacterium]